MKSIRLTMLPLAILAGALAGVAAPAATAGDAGGHHATPRPTAANPVFDLEKAKAEYPLQTCVVAGEKLGDMGDPVDYIHKQDGQPDRLVRFCCKACIKTFRKDPAKYLQMIDAARKA